QTGTKEDQFGRLLREHGPRRLEEFVSTDQDEGRMTVADIPGGPLQGVPRRRFRQARVGSEDAGRSEVVFRPATPGQRTAVRQPLLERVIERGTIHAGLAAASDGGRHHRAPPLPNTGMRGLPPVAERGRDASGPTPSNGKGEDGGGQRKPAEEFPCI